MKRTHQLLILNSQTPASDNRLHRSRRRCFLSTLIALAFAVPYFLLGVAWGGRAFRQVAMLTRITDRLGNQRRFFRMINARSQEAESSASSAGSCSAMLHARS